MATNIENKTLASILDKALNSINENQKHEFFNKWVYINYQNSIDKDTVLKLFTQLSHIENHKFPI